MAKKVIGYNKEMDNIPFLVIEYLENKEIKLIGAFNDLMIANSKANEYKKTNKNAKVMVNQNPNHWVFKRRYYYKIEGC